MPTRREMMIATALSVMGISGCTAQSDTTQPEESKMADNFDIKTLNDDAQMNGENGLSHLTRVHDPETGVLMYAAVSGEVHRGLELETFGPDEHDL